MLGCGVLTVLLAVLLLGWPSVTVLVMMAIFGAYLLVSGLAQVVLAFSAHASGSGRVLLYISGAACLILAVLAFAYSLFPFTGVYLIFLQAWIALGFILRGVATGVVANSDPELPGRGRFIAFGAFSLISGILVLALPLVSLLGLALVVGLCLVIMGALEIVSSFGIRKWAKTVDA
jgi:uncharacterized membrane protein HdeD (DUF308 family)